MTGGLALNALHPCAARDPDGLVSRRFAGASTCGSSASLRSSWQSSYCTQEPTEHIPWQKLLACTMADKEAELTKCLQEKKR